MPLLPFGSAPIQKTAVTPGTYTSTNLTVNKFGQLTAASNGSGGGTTNNYNTTKIDQTGGGTTTYGALAGTVNGSNAVFTVSNGLYVTGTLEVELNGQVQTLGSTGDFTETTPASGTFTFAIAPPTGSIIIASYIVQSTGTGGISGATANGALYATGATTGTSTAALTNGQVLIGSTGTTPVASTITNGSNISVTNGAGSITIAATGLMATSTYDPATIAQQVLGTTATQTTTNKRITKRVTALSANSAAPTINTDNCDVVHITAQSTAITSFTTNLSGTPVDGDTLRISVTGTTAIALTWGTSFEASGGAALPTTTVTTARLDVGFFWNSETSKWRCEGSS